MNKYLKQIIVFLKLFKLQMIKLKILNLSNLKVKKDV